jgi:DNA-binding winged helix-turn-helix (wHTH) protein
MVYTFNGCELNTELHTLRRADCTMQLSPKVFHVLLYLLEHRHRVVSKQELCEHVWSDQVVNDATLESTIRSARRAAGDSGRAQRIIQTQRGYGYRCVAGVECQPPGISASAPPAHLDHRQITALPARFCPACGQRLAMRETPTEGACLQPR